MSKSFLPLSKLSKVAKVFKILSVKKAAEGFVTAMKKVRSINPRKKVSNELVLPVEGKKSGPKIKTGGQDVG